MTVSINDLYSDFVADSADSAIRECHERETRGDEGNLWDCVTDELDAHFIYTNDRAIVLAHYFIETGEAKEQLEKDWHLADFISAAYEQLVENVYEYARDTIDD